MPDVFAMFNDEDYAQASASAGQSYQSEDYSTQVSESANYSQDSNKTFVISLGGSVVVSEQINTELVSRFSSLLNSLIPQGYKFVVVVGGGRTARDYVAAGKTLNTTNFVLDELGIQATRLNAKLVIQAFGNAHPEVLTDINRAKEILASGKIPVFGGLLPGITTDCVAALLAESLKAKFVNLSNVDGVYSSDPKTNPKAKFYTTISHNELIKVVAKAVIASGGPSQNIILDLPSCLVLKRSNIKGFILNAQDTNNLSNAFQGLEFKGTTVFSDEETPTNSGIEKVQF
ncbi:MAG: UMP kinase [Candidatus Diapherotrites archaeon]|nr:UMP kinase [Candidatus Diapherotrites archaeon]